MSAKESTPEHAGSVPANAPVPVPVQQSAAASSTSQDHTSFCFVSHSELPIVCVLSQLTPLHWAVLQPGEKWYPRCLPVWFAADAVVGFGLPGFALVGALSGVTSTKACKKNYILASAGKTIVIKDRIDATGRQHQLYFHSEERYTAEGLVSVLMYADEHAPPEHWDSTERGMGSSGSAKSVEVHDLETTTL